MQNFIRNIVLPIALMASAVSAQATQLAVYDGPAAGLASFNTTVTNAGGTVTHDNWTGLPLYTAMSVLDRTGYSVARTNGGSFDLQGYGTLSGLVTYFSAQDDGAGGKSYGVTLNFDSAINAIGFEVGDWGTCCQPSALYVSFDDGAPILVGKSVTGSDAAVDGKYEVFVGAFDDTGTFTKVQFWGDGFGEALYIGGTVHYALIEEDTLPPADVPEPASLALIGLGLLGAAAGRKSRTKVRTQA